MGGAFLRLTLILLMTNKMRLSFDSSSAAVVAANDDPTAHPPAPLAAHDGGAG